METGLMCVNHALSQFRSLV